MEPTVFDIILAMAKICLTSSGHHSKGCSKKTVRPWEPQVFDKIVTMAKHLSNVFEGRSSRGSSSRNQRREDLPEVVQSGRPRKPTLFDKTLTTAKIYPTSSRAFEGGSSGGIYRGTDLPEGLPEDPNLSDVRRNFDRGQIFAGHRPMGVLVRSRRRPIGTMRCSTKL